MVVFLIGLIVAGVVNSIAATAGVSGNINSFSGAKSLNDLLPTIFYIGLLVIGLGAMGIGAAQAAGLRIGGKKKNGNGNGR
jgi:hypothetical protein